MNNSLELIDPRMHIEQLYKEWDKANPQSKAVKVSRNALKKDIAYAKGTRKFVYELLQNADDEDAYSASFYLDLERGLLLFSHTGNHFDSNDVEKICSYGEEDKKADNLEKTGYKGVGFKAVFCVAKKVTILSEEYRFFFSEEAFPQKAWQIIPIYEEKRDDELGIKIFENIEKNHTETKPFSECVHFILENIDIEAIEQELTDISKNPELLMSLRNIKHLYFHHEQVKFTRVLDAYGSQDEHDNWEVKDFILEKQALVSGITSQMWWKTKKYRVAIPDEIREDLLLITCPKKLKEAGFIYVQFAAKIERVKGSKSRWEFVPQDKTLLFCYLPTGVRFNIPFWINTDFLLNKDRNGLSDSSWNENLFKEIGRTQFKWLADLAVLEDKHLNQSSFKLLKHPDDLAVFYGSVSKRLIDAYKEGFNEGLEEGIPFIPNGENELLNAREAVIDSTGFLSEFFRYTEFNGSQVSADFVKKYCEILEKLGVEVFTWIKLSQKIEHYLEQPSSQGNIEAIYNILDFLCQEASNKLIFSTKKILPAEDLNGYFAGLQSPKESYIKNTSDIHIGAILKFFRNELTFVRVTPNLERWAQQLGTKVISKRDIVISYILPEVSQISTNRNDPRAVELLKFIYHAYVEGHINDDEIKQIGEQGFPVSAVVRKRDNILYYTIELLPVHQCLIFNDKASNERILEVDYAYPEDYTIDNSTPEQWQALFSMMGAKNSISLTFFSDFRNENYFYKKGINGEVLCSQIRQYIGNCAYIEQVKFDEFHREKIAQTDSSTNIAESDRLKHFITFDFIHKIKEPGFSHIFWNAVNEVEERLVQLDKKEIKFIRGSHNNTRRTSIIIEPYLVYYFKKFPSILSTGGELKLSNQLFAPHIKYSDDIGDLPLHFANLPVEISPEIAEFFGFKTNLSFNDCLGLIRSEKERGETKHLKKIYTLLVQYHKVSGEKNILSNEELLNTNNYYTHASSLLAYDITEQTPKSNQLVSACQLDKNTFYQFCKIFGIQLLSKVYEPILKNNDEEKALKLKNFTRNRLCRILPVLAMLEAQASELEAAIHKVFDLCEKFNKLDFFYGNVLIGSYEIGNCFISTFERSAGFYFNRDKRIINNLSDLGVINNIVKELSKYFKLQESTRNLWEINLVGAEDSILFNCVDKAGYSEADYEALYQNTCVLLKADNDIREESLFKVSKELTASLNYEDSQDSSYQPSQNETDSEAFIKTPDHPKNKKEIKSEQPVGTKRILHDDQTSMSAIQKRPKQIEAESPHSPTQRFFKENFSQTASHLNFTQKIGEFEDKAPRPIDPTTLQKYEKRKPYPCERTSSIQNITNEGNDKQKRRLKEIDFYDSNPEYNKETGTLGEGYVFRKIVSTLKEKLALEPVEYSEEEGCAKFERGHQTIKIVWQLKEAEREGKVELPYDITIYLNDRLIYFVEVKSTTENKYKTPFFFSKNEWEIMQKWQNNYILVRVYNVRSDEPRLQAFLNPFQMIISGLITMSNYSPQNRTGLEFVQDPSQFESKEENITLGDTYCYIS